VCLCKNIIGHFGQQIFLYGIKIRNFQVLKGPGNECSKVDSFLGTNVPGNEWSRERKFHHGNDEESWGQIVLRTNVPDTILLMPIKKFVLQVI